MNPMNPAQVEGELIRLSTLLEHTTEQLAVNLTNAARAEVDFKAAYARELLKATGKTVTERESRATIETERLMMNRKTSEAIADATAEMCRTLRAQLNAIQTVSANLRGAWNGQRD